MRRFVLLVVMLLAFGSASAQKIENFRAKLSEPQLNDSTATTGRVTVREVGTAADAVRKVDAAQS
ncbi:MAG: hypothetical protein J6R13_02385, partial [Alistipes sp.]|nr:hypothetical protein [Alistipes sp.]